MKKQVESPLDFFSDNGWDLSSQAITAKPGILAYIYYIPSRHLYCFEKL